MLNPLTLVADDDGALQFLTNLGQYSSCEGTDIMLDLMREIQLSGNYQWYGLVFPGQGNTTIGPQQTANGTVQVPAGSYVTGITHFNDPIVNPEGYKIKIYDKGTKASIFYGDYALERTISSNMQVIYGVGDTNPPTDPGMNSDDPFGPNLLLSPFIITPPGVLGWEIVNLSVAAAQIQVLLSCAVPINSQSTGLKLVQG